MTTVCPRDVQGIRYVGYMTGRRRRSEESAATNANLPFALRLDAVELKGEGGVAHEDAAAGLAKRSVAGQAGDDVLLLSLSRPREGDALLAVEALDASRGR